MNTSYDKKTYNKDFKTKKRNILTERTINIETRNIIKSTNIIRHLKGFKKYSRKKNPKIKNNYESIAYNYLIKKYNYTSDKYNMLCIDNLINHKCSHLVCEFDEQIIINFISEFIKREYTIKEIKERIPIIDLYYRNYSIFFGQPFFKNLVANYLIRKNGEKKARLYHKNFCLNGESKDEENKNLGFAQYNSDNDEENTNSGNLKNSNIFDSSIKESIDNITLMTTINSNINKTIKLEIDNEKIEIFRENKFDKSNDTTLSKIINFIDNKNLDKKTKNKDKMKKDILSFENINMIINQKIKKKINTNEFNKKRLFDLINKNINVTLKKINFSSIKKQFIKNNNIINTNTKRNIIVPKIKINDYKNKKKLMSNKNINTNRVYNKKANILSLGDEEITNIINSKLIKSSRLGTYESCNMYKNKYMKIKRVYSIKNNKNKSIKKIKTFKTLGNLYSLNKINNKRIILTNIIDKKILDSINFTETQISKDKDKQQKKIKRRNYISLMNKINTYNKKINTKNIKKIITNKKKYSENLTHQTTDREKGIAHQRIKTNNLENLLTFSKCLNTTRDKIHKKPFLQIDETAHKKKNSNIKNFNSFYNHTLSNNSINCFKNFINLKNKKKIDNNISNKKSEMNKYINKIIRKRKDEYQSKINERYNKNKDIFQIALSYINNQNNNMKNNYNLNININNNEINLNQNNNINNNTYSINSLTDRNITKNNNIKNNVNLKYNRNKINKTIKNGFCININKKKGKNIKKRNYEKSIKDALIFITNNNLTNSYILNNSLENNDKMNKTTKTFHVNSESNLIDTMNNKRFISSNRNLNKNK